MKKTEKRGHQNVKYLLGIDIGTSSCKAALFDFSGNVLAQASKKYPVFNPKPHYAEQSAEDWLEGAAQATKAILSQGFAPEEIAGIGVSGQSWSAIPVDETGKPLANTPIWMDGRAVDICDGLAEEIGEETIFRLSGNPLSPTYSLPKVLWFKKYQPELYHKTHQFLQSNSYIVYKLTGVYSQDLSQGYGYAFFDIENCRYDEEMAKKMGCDLKKIPPLYACHQVVGTVTPEAAALTGLAVGTPVVAGGLDAACATLGAGVIRDGQTQEQGGTAGGMSICTDTCRTHPKLICSAHVVPGRWLLQGGTVGGGGTMEWYKKHFGKEEELLYPDRNVFDALTTPCERIAPGSGGVIFLPYMQGERSPIWDPMAKGVFYGLSFATEKAHMTRSVLEGCAYALRHNLETAGEVGAYPAELTATGGAANSLLWTQIKSDVTGLPITVSNNDAAGCLGAAILAGVGTGVFPDFQTAVEWTVTSTRSHTPDPAKKQIYDAGYALYREIYENLKETMRRTP